MNNPFLKPALVFLAASIPTVLLLQYLAIGGDFVLLIAMVAGAFASAPFMPKKRPPGDK